MKRIIATVFLFIFISVFSLATFAESYPIQKFFGAWHYSVNGTDYSSSIVNVTSDRNLIFTFPDSVSGTFINRLELYIMPYSDNPSSSTNLYGVEHITGHFNAYIQGQTPSALDNSLAYVYNQVFDPINNTWSLQSSGPISNGSFFDIVPTSGISTRLSIQITNFVLTGSNSIVLDFSDLAINDINVIDNLVVSQKVNDFNESSGEVISSIESFEAFENSAFNSMINVTEDINAASSYVSDVASFLEDSYEATALYAGTFAVINNFSIISGFIVIVAVFMVVSYIIFGRAG